MFGRLKKKIHLRHRLGRSSVAMPWAAASLLSGRCLPLFGRCHLPPATAVAAAALAESAVAAFQFMAAAAATAETPAAVPSASAAAPAGTAGAGYHAALVPTVHLTAVTADVSVRRRVRWRASLCHLGRSTCAIRPRIHAGAPQAMSGIERPGGRQWARLAGRPRTSAHGQRRGSGRRLGRDLCPDVHHCCFRRCPRPPRTLRRRHCRRWFPVNACDASLASSFQRMRVLRPRRTRVSCLPSLTTLVPSGYVCSVCWSTSSV